jgi:hypothetical protein
LVKIFNKRGLKVLVNIGGEAKPHELRLGPQIAVNNFGAGRGEIRTPVPNLVREKGEEIGTLFARESVDEIVSFKLPTSLDTKALAEGAAKVLKSGGKLRMTFLPNQEYVDTFARQLREFGFRSAKAQFTGPGGPIPSNASVEAIR